MNNPPSRKRSHYHSSRPSIEPEERTSKRSKQEAVEKHTSHTPGRSVSERSHPDTYRSTTSRQSGRCQPQQYIRRRGASPLPSQEQIKQHEIYLKEITDFMKTPHELTPDEARKRLAHANAITRQRYLQELNKQEITAIRQLKNIAHYCVGDQLPAGKRCDVIEKYLAPLKKHDNVCKMCHEIICEGSLIKTNEFKHFCYVLSDHYLSKDEMKILIDEVKSHEKDLISWISQKSKEAINVYFRKGSVQECIRCIVALRSLYDQPQRNGFSAEIQSSDKGHIGSTLNLFVGILCSWEIDEFGKEQESIIQNQITFLRFCTSGDINFPNNERLLSRIFHLINLSTQFHNPHRKTLLTVLWSIYHNFYKNIKCENSPFNIQINQITEQSRTMNVDTLGEKIQSFRSQFPHVTDGIRAMLDYASAIYHTRYYIENVKNTEHIKETKKPDYKKIAIQLLDAQSDTDCSVSTLIGLADLYMQLDESGKAWRMLREAQVHTDAKLMKHKRTLTLTELKFLAVDSDIHDDAAKKTILEILEENHDTKPLIDIFTGKTTTDILHPLDENQQEMLNEIMYTFSKRKCFRDLFVNTYNWYKKNYTIPHGIHYLYIFIHIEQEPEIAVQLASSFLFNNDLIKDLSADEAKTVRTKFANLYITAAKKFFTPEQMESLFSIVLSYDVHKYEIDKAMASYHWHSAIDLLDRASSTPEEQKLKKSLCTKIKGHLDKAICFAEKSGILSFEYEIKAHVACLWEKTTAFRNKRMATDWRPTMSATSYFLIAHEKKPQSDRLSKKSTLPAEAKLRRFGRFRLQDSQRPCFAPLSAKK